ncbi:S41 family peptidase [Haloimpatiens lingqiaonensis]|uniref:S41 family peptidase n=1 Tax=Haloimpatiens lingqiaonensis TaxID=1380675 RepID=UPI0010FDF571|nr:S41 family peptidase [Haloimpatiens lingqiaonensis]
MTNKKKWISVTAALLIVTNLFTGFIFSRKNNVVVKDDTVATFNKLFLVRDRLYKYYDGAIDDEVLVEGAIKGMTAALKDPYTVFMNKKEFEEFNSQIEGSYVGIGIQVGVKDNKIVIISAFDNSPAKKAGIVSGDIIEKVNGVSVNGEQLEKAVSMMKGKVGREIQLTLFREKKGEFSLNLKAEKIEFQTVKGEVLEGGIGYIEISMFDENTSKDFNKKLKELKSKGMKSIILDLRGNPGGSLKTCVEVASNFVPKKSTIVSTVDKNKKKIEYTSEGGEAIGMPLVVLTDGGTASASEIVSGAVKDYKLGTLIGEKTFGKGVVQTMLDTKDGTALKVTIAKYYTPSGKNIHKIGINPDIEVKYSEELKEETAKSGYNRSKDPQFQKALEIIKEKMQSK